MVGEPLARLLAAPSLFRTSHYRALPYINPPKIKHLCSGSQYWVSSTCTWISGGSRILGGERSELCTVYVNEFIRKDSILELKKAYIIICIWSSISTLVLFLFCCHKLLFFSASWNLKATVPFAYPSKVCCILYITLPFKKYFPSVSYLRCRRSFPGFNILCPFLSALTFISWHIYLCY